MSRLLPAALLLPARTPRTPLTQFQRFRGKINIQRPRQPHYERALVLAVTQPQLPPPAKTTTCFQRNPRYAKEQVANPYNDIVAREVHNWLQQSRMVAIFHLSSMPADELFRVRVLLHKQNMHLKSYGRQIIAKAIAETRYAAILPLFEANHCMVFSPEQRVAQLMRLTRKVPQMQLLGGIVEATLLSRNEFIAYGQLPALNVAQAQLVQTLNMAAGNLVRSLEAHQNHLVNVLDGYAKAEPTQTTPQAGVEAGAQPSLEQ